MFLPERTDRINLSIADLPKGDDPDSFIRREGPAAFRALIAAAKPWGEWRFTREEAHITDDTDAYERSRIVSRLLPVVRTVGDQVVRRHYRRRLARIGQVDEPTIARLLNDRLQIDPPPWEPLPVNVHRIRRGGVPL